nr:hypothetical protein [Anaerolineae bacterium]
AILEARQVQVGGWARVMAEAEGGPLLLAGTEGSRQVAILTFDLHNSDLPLQIAFPILMANLLEWYAPARPFQAAERLQPGDPVIIRPQGSTTGYRVTLPDGTRESYSATADALTFTRTIQPGFYTVELLAGGQTTTRGSFAVNLFSPFESDIAPRGSVLIGQLEIGDVAPEDEYGQRELWPWLALLALVILVLEWWVYHRGSTITHRERAAREAAPKRRLLYFGRRR